MAFVLVYMQERGFFRRHGLDPQLIDCCAVPTCPHSTLREAPWKEHRNILYEGVQSGAYDFMCGFHSEPYFKRFYTEDNDRRLVNLAQTANTWTSSLFTMPGSGIASLAQIQGKRIGIPAYGTPEFNAEVYLQSQHFVPERDGLTYVKIPGYQHGLEALRTGTVDATFMQSPDDFQAQRDGLVRVAVPPMYTHWSLKVMATRGYAKEHESRLRAYLIALAEGVGAFKADSGAAIRSMKSNWERIGRSDPAGATVDPDDEPMLRHVYQSLANALVTNLLPDPRAIANIYEHARRLFPDEPLIENPMMVWDTHIASSLG